MSGYTRQALANIQNDSVADADDLNTEFNQVQSAFNNATGHKHDGTSGEGAPITKIGPVQDVVVSVSAMYPKVDATLDLGTSILSYKDGYFTGVVDAATFTGAVTSSAVTITGGTITGITDLAIADGGTGASTAAGALTNLGLTATAAEINYTGGVTSSIQTQLNAKEPTITGAITTVVTANLDPNTVPVSNASGKIGNSTTTTTELSYLNNVTSDIQTQINSKQATITGGATTIATSNLTASRALVSDVSGKVAVSAVTTTTELEYLNGVTSAIQTQLNAKQPLDAGLTDIAALAVTNGNFIVGNGTNWVAEAPATALLSLGVTSTAAELNKLDGATLTVTELNYVDGVTSSIQTQLNNTIGTTQTWAARGRTHSTVYENTTSAPVMVNISATVSTGRYIQVSATGAGGWIDVGYLSATGATTVSYIVPVGWFHRINGATDSILVWSELY